MAAACRNVEAATLADDGSPPVTRTTFPTCRAHYPGGSSGCSCRLLPRPCSLPQMAGGSASALSLSRPAQASLTLRPIGSLSRPRRPLSRGSSPASYPTKPLASFRINRQLSGWNPPPLMIRAFGAHCHSRTFTLSASGASDRHHRRPLTQQRSAHHLSWLCAPDSRSRVYDYHLSARFVGLHDAVRLANLLKTEHAGRLRLETPAATSRAISWSGTSDTKRQKAQRSRVLLITSSQSGCETIQRVSAS